jgi:hypothetical protein
MLQLENGAAAEQFTDYSGNGRHAVQGTPTSRMTFLTNQQNGLPILRADGGDFYTFAPPANLIQPATIYLVVRCTATLGSSTYVLGSASSSVRWDIRRSGAANTWAVRAGTTVVTGPSASDSNWHILVAQVNGASSVIRVDGTAVTGDIGTGETNAIRIGNSAGVGSFTGDIGEIAVYLAAHDLATRNAAVAALQAKWGLA